jgi:formylglycine-generating enzyme required for sulfatase activity
MKCGESLPDDAKFCFKCGDKTKLNWIDMDIIPRATDVPDENVPDGVPEPVNEIDPFFVQKIGKRGKDTRLANAKRGKWKWRLAFALILVLILGGVGIWQYQEQVVYRRHIDLSERAMRTQQWGVAESHLGDAQRSSYLSKGARLAELKGRLSTEKYRLLLEELARAIDMVRINGGTFQMGSNSSEASSDEQPAHKVTLSSFHIGKYEVTQGLWRAVIGSNPSRFLGGDKYPVEQVSWNDVQEFLRKLNQLTGKRYRLPTEAEWEYAARGGTKEDRYGELYSIAQYAESSTHPVGGKQPNAYGLYDMLGNVWEWCSDWYDKNYYSRSPDDNPKGPSTGSHRVYRGGSWKSGARDVRAPCRALPYHLTPGIRFDYLGFRLAMDAE